MTTSLETSRKKKYPCPLSISGNCEFAGNKFYNYGFVNGSANYCRHKLEKRFVSDIKVCPKPL